MKIKAERNNIVTAVAIASNVAVAKSSIPMLESILLRAENGKLVVSATDANKFISVPVEDTEIKEEGAVAVDSKFLKNLLKTLSGDTVSLESDADRNVTIRSGRAKFKTISLDPTDFPKEPEVEGTDLSVDSGELKAMIESTLFSAGKPGDQRMGTEGLTVENGKLNLYALDGYRIASRSVDLESKTEEAKENVPREYMNLLGKILPEEGKVDLCLGEKFIRTKIGDITFTGSVYMSNNMFDISRLQNGTYETKVKLNREELIGSLERSILLHDNTTPLVIDVTESEIVCSIGSGHSALTERIEAAVEGKGLTIGLNPQFLLDAVKAIDEENVVIYMNNERSPISLSGDQYFYLVLPINIGMKEKKAA